MKAIKINTKQKRINEFNQKNYYQIAIRFSYFNENDIIDYIANIKNKKKYFKDLIERDMIKKQKAVKSDESISNIKSKRDASTKCK